MNAKTALFLRAISSSRSSYTFTFDKYTPIIVSTIVKSPIRARLCVVCSRATAKERTPAAIANP